MTYKQPKDRPPGSQVGLVEERFPEISRLCATGMRLFLYIGGPFCLCP